MSNKLGGKIHTMGLFDYRHSSKYLHQNYDYININPVPRQSSAFTCIQPPFGTAQAILLRLAQLEAQLVLNLISNLATANQSSYGNPFVLLSLLQATQRTPYLTTHRPPSAVALSHLPHRRNVNPTTHMVNPPSLNGTTVSSVTEIRTLTAEGHFQAKKVIRKTENHSQNLSSVDSPQCKSTTNVIMPLDGQVLKTLGEKEQDPTLHLPSERVTKALASFNLSLEDLELLSHCPDDHLTKEMLPFIIQDMQKAKTHTSPRSNMPKVIEYGHVSRTSSDRAGSHRNSSYTYGMQNDSDHSHGFFRSERLKAHDFIYKNLTPQSRTLRRDLSGRRSKYFFMGPQHGHAEVSRKRPDSVRNSSPSIRHCFISPGHNKTRHCTTCKLSASKSVNIQTPVNMENASTRTLGAIRLSRIPLDFSESELIKMATPFGEPVEVLMATELDMVTRLEWKKALVFLSSEVSAQEMVKVYSAIPPHMREQSLELVSQTVDLTSFVSVFYAFVGPSTSNGLLTPVDHLLVVCNVPHQPCAATGVLQLLKPFGQVSRMLVFNPGNKVDVNQCLWNNNCIQMVLEMESAAVASSVYEWSQKIPCIYHNHHLSFIRGSNIEKNTPEMKSM